MYAPLSSNVNCFFAPQGRVEGVTDKKLKEYGKRFTEAIRSFCKENSLPHDLFPV